MATDIFGEGSLAFGLLMTSTSPTYWYVGEGGPEFAATDGRLGLGLEIRRMFGIDSVSFLGASTPPPPELHQVSSLLSPKAGSDPIYKA